MLRFRSGTSVDAVPKQRFARAWRPSTLLRWWGFARELPSTGSEAKVRSGLKAVDANTGFASVRPSTLFQLSLETGVRPLPLMVSKRFRSTWMGGRREDTPLYERRQTPQPPSINSNNTKNKIIRYRKIYDPENDHCTKHNKNNTTTTTTTTTTISNTRDPSNKQHTNNNVFDVLMREKDDGQYDLERGFLRATSWHVSPLQICYHNTCTIYYINSNTISQATLDTRVVTPNTCTDAVYYRYWIISKHWWHVNVINRCLLK